LLQSSCALTVYISSLIMYCTFTVETLHHTKHDLAGTLFGVLWGGGTGSVLEWG